MPIDFRQVAAPSFSDSNTLVALAAKQQQEAMTGIQGAWTGAMDAVGNRVQGEMEGIANQASFSQLTDPTQRAALDQQIMAANTLGMGDVREINKYTDARRGVQLGLVEDVNRVDSNARIEADTVEQKLMNDSSYFMANLYSQRDAEEDEDKKKEFERIGEQYLKDNRFTDTQKARIGQLAGQHNQKQRLADIDELTKMWGPAAAEAMVNANNQNTDASKVNVALAVDKHVNGGKGKTLDSKRKFADSLELQGAIKDDGTPDYNVLKQSLDNRIARSAIEQERVDPETMSYDQYLIKNSDLMEQKLGSFGRKTDVKGLQAHFKWAEDNGAPYPEREKILITEGFLTGSIKMNLFTDNFFDGILDGNGNRKIAEAIAKTHLPKVETEFNTKRMQSGQDAFDPIIKLLTSEGVPPDQILTNLGITSLDHPQAKYLPENMKKALELLVTNNKAAYMAEVPDGTMVGETRGQIAAKSTPKPDLNIGKLVNNTPPSKGSTGSGVLANKNTEDLAAIGKANNVGNSSKKVTSNTAATSDRGSAGKEYTMSLPSGRKVDAVRLTTADYLAAGYSLHGKFPRVPKDSNNKYLYTPDGDRIFIKSNEDFGRHLEVSNTDAAKAKTKRGEDFLAGKVKYTAPSNLDKPDPNHPLANRNSDRLDNFVPYEDRDAWGNRKTEKKNGDKSFKYSSYSTYMKLKKAKADRTVKSK